MGTHGIESNLFDTSEGRDYKGGANNVVERMIVFFFPLRGCNNIVIENVFKKCSEMLDRVYAQQDTKEIPE